MVNFDKLEQFTNETSILEHEKESNSNKDLLQAIDKVLKIFQSSALIDLEKQVSSTNKFSKSYDDFQKNLSYTKNQLKPIFYNDKSDHKLTDSVLYGILLTTGVVSGALTYTSLPDVINETAKVIGSGTTGILAGTTSGLIYESVFKKIREKKYEKEFNNIKLSLDELIDSAKDYNTNYLEFNDLLAKKNISSPKFLKEEYVKANNLITVYEDIINSK